MSHVPSGLCAMDFDCSSSGGAIRDKAPGK